jgi:hypothetical protein
VKSSSEAPERLSWAAKRTASAADVGFIPRVDTRTADATVLRSFWGEKDGWYSRLAFGVETSRTEDHAGIETNRETDLILRYQGPWQSQVSARVIEGQELYNGTMFDKNYVTVYGEMRPTGNLYTYLTTTIGEAIDYDNTRRGRLLHLDPGVTYAMGNHFTLTLDHLFERLDVAGGRLYRANLTQARLVYQIDTRTFVRLILHRLDLARDPSLYIDTVSKHSSTLFSQLLFSYKINPQTVLFLGYSDTDGEETGIQNTRIDRTVFLKLGYAWLM